MEKKALIKTAAELKQPSAEAVSEFSNMADKMASILNDILSKRTDIVQLVGEGNLEMMYDNHRNHLRFMVSLFQDYDPTVFTETVLWVFRAYRSHGFRLTYWPAQLDNWVSIFKKELSQDCFNEIYPFYHWMIVNNPSFAFVSDQVIDNNTKPMLGKHD
jgi:hypothetical protein